MPPRKKGKGVLPPASGGGGGIDALPDGVIHHILGFLDAKEVVRTCARLWCHLWRSASSVRIRTERLTDVSTFLEHVLLLRTVSPLDTFELKFDAYDYEDSDNDKQRVHLWVRYALLCKARVLKLSSYLPLDFPLHDLPLVSQHMRILKLFGVSLKNRTCDFVGCPSLEHLHMTNCCLSFVRKISSKSLKHLSLTGCHSVYERFHTLIYAPSLVSLKLDDQGYQDFSSFRTPVLDRMPLLKNAFVRLTHMNEDSCIYADSGNCGDDNCIACYGIEHDNSRSCVLLEGLSEAENLSAESNTFNFKRDLKQCPTFSNSRTLFLNDYWCVEPDFHELNCILKHSPVLEMLTLHIFSKESKPMFRIKGSRNPSESAAAISVHLKMVEVTCEAIDHKVIKVLKLVSSFYISKLTGNIHSPFHQFLICGSGTKNKVMKKRINGKVIISV